VADLVILALDLLLGQQIRALVVEDDVDLLGRVAANVRPEHDQVVRVAAQLLLLQAGRVQLDVAAAAVDLLLVLHRELHDERLARVREGRELGADAVEARVLARLDAHVLERVAKELAVRQLELALLAALEGRLHPALAERLAVRERLAEVHRLAVHSRAAR